MGGRVSKSHVNPNYNMSYFNHKYGIGSVHFTFFFGSKISALNAIVFV